MNTSPSEKTLIRPNWATPLWLLLLLTCVGLLEAALQVKHLPLLEAFLKIGSVSPELHWHGPVGAIPAACCALQQCWPQAAP